MRTLVAFLLSMVVALGVTTITIWSHMTDIEHKMIKMERRMDNVVWGTSVVISDFGKGLEKQREHIAILDAEIVNIYGKLYQFQYGENLDGSYIRPEESVQDNSAP